MMNILAVAAFAAGTNALVGRSDSCCFHLTASGGASGSLGQLSDGQVRVGDTTLSAAQFCISDSVITDSEGRGCVITCACYNQLSLVRSSIANMVYSGDHPVPVR